MNSYSLPRNDSFFSEVSLPDSVFERCATTPNSTSSHSGASTPDTERSAGLENSQYGLLSNTHSRDDFILVVGGLGFIGSHTSWELLKSGQNVIIIDNLSNAERNVLDKLEYLRDKHYKTRNSWPTLDFYEGDFRDQKLLHTIFTKYAEASSPTDSPSTPKSKITGVIHFAGYKSVSESFQKPLQYYSNNLCGLVDFCFTLSEFNIKTLVFSSSATVYGELANGGGRLLEDQCDNTGCSGLTNPYGRTKWMCEAILKDLAVSDPTWNITVLRYFNPIGCDESGILGENPRGPPNNLMPVVIRAMTGELKALNIFGTDWDTPDGTAVRDFIHVSDLATGHLAALNSTEGEGFHVYNLGSGMGHSVREVVGAMQDVSGMNIPVQESGRRKGDVGVCIAEPSKSRTDLGWETKKTLREACWDVCRYLGYVGEKATMEK